MIYRERLAPVALTGEDSVAETVIDLHASYLMLLYEDLCGLYSVLDIESIERERLTIVFHCLSSSSRRIGDDAFLSVVRLLTDVSTLDERDDRKIEMLGKSIVTAVMGRNRHDGSGAISSEHILGDIDRALIASDRIDTVSA